MADHRIPYAATATMAYPHDLIRKMEKAKERRGTRFIHLLSPCPPGWRIPSEMSVRLSRLAVRTRVFPLYEIEEGKVTIQEESLKEPLGVEAYLKVQGRFAHLKAHEVEGFQKWVDGEWERLMRRARC
jgi:pyruvate/2-oxoacid:ferredoxin oxidoreductase beta subunit